MKTTFNFKVWHKSHFFSLVSVFLLGMYWQSPGFADVAVIAHPSASIGSIDAETLKSIYLGKLKLWPDGTILVVIDQSFGSKTRIKFVEEIIGRTEKKYDAYWSRKAFSGKGTRPKNPGNDASIKAWISSHRDSIGYIDSSMVDSSVKVLLTIKQ